MIGLNIIIGLIGLGLVVFVHELGHLLAAKAVGIEVEAFSIGWGRKLWGTTYKGTEYRISLFPFGGYCKMKGEEMLVKAWESGDSTIPAERGTFYGATPWRRILVAVAGPLMNVLFAVFALAVVWFFGFTVQTFENRIILASEYQNYAQPEVQVAEEAGLQSGDYVIAIDGEPIEHYREIQQTVAQSPNQELQFTVRRNGEQLQIAVTPRLNRETGAGQIGIFPWIEPVVGAVRAGSGARIAGVREGDRIVAVNDTEVDHSVSFTDRLQQTSGYVHLTVARNGEEQRLQITPSHTEDGRREIGVSFKPIEVSSPELGPFGALAAGVRETGNTITLYVRGLGMLFAGIDLTQALAGPVRITYIVGEVATEGFTLGIGAGFTAVFNFLSLLSVALFIMNLLPIPALDGGQILLFAFEGITRRRLSPKLVYRYQFIGTVLILSLIIFALFSDILFLTRR